MNILDSRRAKYAAFCEKGCNRYPVTPETKKLRGIVDVCFWEVLSRTVCSNSSFPYGNYEALLTVWCLPCATRLNPTAKLSYTGQSLMIRFGANSVRGVLEI
ncbi:hypothetical protein AVEN_25636-1 [Araneus ventricosus]|uniref:Uncharacterized protein n=1 Tax=Araneus ventricosus TaxID=182803 RepID=A0A4Y2BNX4_ARAVE|nr:hypothetical protein AVEN_25636-1 [Araneus ventricosus]